MSTTITEEWEEEEEPLAIETRPSDELLSERYRTSQLKIVRSSVDYSTDQLVLMIRESQINMSPLYQRRNRWDQKKKSRLIESLLLNIPIPPIFLYESDYGSYEVMDGRQRLETLNDFLSGELVLKGLEYWREIDGLKYQELPKVFQLGLRRRTVGAVILLAESDGKIAVESDIRMVLFERLNTGGVRLNPQELRNALYQGNFNTMIVELSSNSLFRKLWDIPETSDLGLLENSLYASMGDCDLVLRFFALREVLVGLRTGSLRNLMDGSARDNQNLHPDKLIQMKHNFIESLEIAEGLFGAECFRLPGTRRLSKSLYDASMVAISLHPERKTRNHNEVKEALAIAATTTAGYSLIVGRGNTLQAIRDRCELLSSIIYG